MLTQINLPKKYDGDPVTKRLWLQSRRDSKGNVIPAGQTRSITVANLHIMIDALRIMAPRAWHLLHTPEYAKGAELLVRYLLVTVAEAFAPSLM